jgi:hypothetical protein
MTQTGRRQESPPGARMSIESQQSMAEPFGGDTSVRVFLAVATVVAVVALGGLPASSAPAGSTFQGDPQAVAEVQAAYVKFGALRTYRARMGAGGQSMVISFVNPDRMSIQMTQGEIIRIGGDTWIKASATCQKLPAGAPMGPGRDDVDPTSKRSGTVTVQRIGPETIDGTATMSYAVTAVDSQGTTSRSKLFVTRATSLIRRLETQTKEGPAVIDYFDYDAPITITAPC